MIPVKKCCTYYVYILIKVHLEWNFKLPKPEQIHILHFTYLGKRKRKNIEVVLNKIRKKKFKKITLLLHLFFHAKIDILVK